MDLFCGTECAHAFWKQARRDGSMAKAASKVAAGGTATPGKGKSSRGGSLPVGSSESTEDWTLVARSKNYSPTPADVGHQLSCRCVSTDHANSCEKTVKTNTVLPQPGPPPPRVLTHARPNPRAKGLPLRVVSFNVLAEIYATKQQYPDCPMWALSWNYRKNNLLREIRQFNGDIISLQEVQADRFEDFFLPEMRKLGYEGLYKKKTRESMGREGKVDGCALFYRTSSLKLLEKYVIEFNDAAMAMAHAGTLSNKRSASPDELQKGLQRVLRDNIAQVVVLETVPHPSRPSQMPQRVCVCNTHITANPEFSDVKLWQTAMLLKELEKFNATRKLPLVLCGDFNALADSAVYELLSTEQIRPNHPGLRYDPCNILPPAQQLRHGLMLQSAHVQCLGSEPPFTNFTRDFVGCIDYIWLSCESVAVSACYTIPTEEEIRELSDSGLPHPQYPSDHFALCFDLKFLGGGGMGRK